MKEKTRMLLRMILTALCLLTLGWIFGNSLATGTQSSELSKEVTEGVQDAIGVVAPSSPLATAKGAEFDLLHAFVRNAGHFCQFALFGALLFWCVLSYSARRVFFPVAPVLSTGIAFFDEYCLQKNTEGRAAEFSDVVLDCLGAYAGIIFAAVAVWVLFIIIKKRKENVGV